MKTPHFDITPIAEWLPKAKRPYIISGPCSAETEEQVLNTAKQLAKLGKVNVLRAGIWKPRTRPNSFEGIGEIGLNWLVNAGKEIGLPTATEIATANHVDLALKQGVDILWLGARTTVNPFSVQEIANALKGTNIPVMVKNPINPDLQLWIGALERINQAGITKMVAIHRGFSSTQKTQFRNVPMWEIPIELKTLFPELDIICDPSHIAGKRGLLLDISQRALDLDMAGLMIESHINPDEAWSDASQQVSPNNLADLFHELKVRLATSKNNAFQTKLDYLRSQIDEFDDAVFETLSKRMAVAEKIGEHKKENDVTILQVSRWEEILRKRLAESKNQNLSEEFIKDLLKLIHKESIRKQTEIMNRDLV